MEAAEHLLGADGFGAFLYNGWNWRRFGISDTPPFCLAGIKGEKG